ncbi:hypothetical protein ILYODFUR_014977, partial [Ilyodon furcidens]
PCWGNVNGVTTACQAGRGYTTEQKTKERKKGETVQERIDMEGEKQERTCKLKPRMEAMKGEKIMSRKRCRGANQMKKFNAEQSVVLTWRLSRSDIECTH